MKKNIIIPTLTLISYCSIYTIEINNSDTNKDIHSDNITTKCLIPLDIENITTDILNNYQNYISIAFEFSKIAEQVLDNAKLGNINISPETESLIYNSLHAIQTSSNNTELLLRVKSDQAYT